MPSLGAVYDVLPILFSILSPGIQTVPNLEAYSYSSLQTKVFNKYLPIAIELPPYCLVFN